ncbi:MAG: hypothetical protein QM644_21425 [Mobilitalea sp.]
MKENYPLRIDDENGIVYAWFTRMEYRGGVVTSDLETKLILFEDKYYEIYQKVGKEIFIDLFSKMHSNIRQFFHSTKFINAKRIFGLKTRSLSEASGFITTKRKNVMKSRR